MDGDAGMDKNGNEVFKVKLQDGSEQIIAYSALIESLEEEEVDDTGKLDEEQAKKGEQVEDDFRNFVQRAPRPTLHLLRLCDRDEALAGNGPDLNELEMDNYNRAYNLGSDGMEELLRRCG